jgi:tripartite-type tricarboxylate transporter receptor subunit TctC
MKKTSSIRVFAMCVLFVAGMALPSLAQGTIKYPTKSVEIIVSFAPGGESDSNARMVGRYLEKSLAASFPVINKPGASGEIGWTTVANSKKDGYTIAFINPPSFVMLPVQRGKDSNYTLDAFEPIANIVSDPGTIAVRADSRFKSLKEIIDAAKANPDTITVAVGGAGTSEAMTATRFEGVTGAKFKKVQFEGTGPMLAALLGGHVDFAIMNISGGYSLYADGKIRYLATGAGERAASMPQLPTYKELGYDVIHVSMRGFAAPKGTDMRIIEILDKAIKAALDDPEFKAKAEELKLPLDYIDHTKYKAYLNDIDRYYRDMWAKNPW